jgi:hypothetical protein
MVNRTEETIRCTECNHEETMRFLPLFIVTGASGVGKTTVVPELRKLLPECDVFETDIIHCADWDQVKHNWLRIAHSIAQSGRVTVLCGTIMPWDIEKCDHYPFFSHVYFLNLHCDDESRAARLRSRPAWRGCTEEFIADHRNFAAWLLDNAELKFDPPMPTVDTTDATASEAAGSIRDWIMDKLNAEW